MMNAMLLFGLVAHASLLQVQTVPWTPGSSSCFPADLNMDGSAEVFVLEMNRLRVFGKRDSEALVDITLPTGTSAIDIADIDYDGTAEIVAIQQQAIVAIALQGKESGKVRPLFTQENQYSHATGQPFPCVLVVDRDGAPMCALPQNGMLEVRSLTGELMESYPVGVRTPNHLSINRPFSYWVNQHAQAGPSQGLEFRISSVVSFRPLQTGEQSPIDIESPTSRLGTPRQQRDTADLAPEEWPWFAVGASPTTQFRALYGAGQSNSATTTICIRSAPSDGTPGDTKVGPPRHYPGSIILRENRAPDFNGDGYTDILLWKSRQPGLTASSLSRAATSSTWPLTITAHMFVPEKQRYAPVPSGNLVIDVPVAWWLLASPSGPLRDVFLQDFNGDGVTDFGCFTSDRTLSIWVASEGEFGSLPAFQHKFPTPMTGILLEADLDGQGSTTLAIETSDALHLLRPWSPISDF